MNSIFDEIRNNPDFSVGKSITWYTNLIKDLKVKTRDPRLLSDPKRVRSSVEPGYLYFFGYDPKHKDTLPHYDRFPLSFIFSFTPGGFNGINFHYLPYDMRFKLFDTMVKIDYNNIADNKKLELSWNTLKKASKFPGVKPAVKSYLIDHVQTKFIKIPISDWKTALLLPTEQFVGASARSIWNNSRKISRP